MIQVRPAVPDRDKRKGTCDHALRQREIAALEAESGSAGGVDPERLQEKQVVPARGDLDLLRYDVLWVY